MPQKIDRPPSTGRIVPVTKSDCNKYSTACTISSASPMRLSRLFSTDAVKSISICSGGDITVPGAIPLTCTSGDKARANPFVSEIKAAFEAQ